jgi:hypothetical protein
VTIEEVAVSSSSEVFNDFMLEAKKLRFVLEALSFYWRFSDNVVA